MCSTEVEREYAAPWTRYERDRLPVLYKKYIRRMISSGRVVHTKEQADGIFIVNVEDVERLHRPRLERAALRTAISSGSCTRSTHKGGD